MTQFKVGDKVRIIGKGAAGLTIGTVATVSGADRFGVYLDVKNIYGGTAFYYSDKLELVSDKPSKKQRLTDAEKRIAELEAKVEALEKAQKPTITQNITVKPDADVSKITETLIASLRRGGPVLPRKKLSLTPNEQRKAIIAEAKAFVSKYERLETGSDWINIPFTRDIGHVSAKFCVNDKKRTVVAVVQSLYSSEKKYSTKGIAKCAPDDVFNADIGKAIALGRTLGLDVKRFEQAVKPTGVVVGHRVKIFSPSGDYLRTLSVETVYSPREATAQYLINGHFGYHTKDGDRILDDTDAKY